jgi:hypothetical protein
MPGYWNEIDPKEAKAIIQSERDCFQTRAAAEADLEAQGRFKRQNETRVTGSAPVTYPRLPSGPWSEGDPAAPDPATDELGYGINEVEPILERRDATSANGLTSAVENASAPEEPNDSIAVGSSTPTASSVIGSYDAGTESAEVSSSPPPADSTPPRKSSFRRF